MLSDTLQEALNDQIANEYYSAYFYLSMAAYCDSVNMGGCARWMRIQHDEELLHARRLFDSVIDMGGRVVLNAIEKPPAEFDSALDVFEKTLKHERKVTAMINELYALAVKENNYAVQTVLQWFLTEQVEEEKTASEIVEQFRMVGKDSAGLLVMDGQLGARVPAAAEGKEAG